MSSSRSSAPCCRATPGRWTSPPYCRRALTSCVNTKVGALYSVRLTSCVDHTGITGGNFSFHVKCYHLCALSVQSLKRNRLCIILLHCNDTCIVVYSLLSYNWALSFIYIICCLTLYNLCN